MKRLNLIRVSLCAGIALGMFFLSLVLRDEGVRLGIALVALVALGYGGIDLRGKFEASQQVRIIKLGFATMAVVCFWLLLNVARFYLYDSAIIGTANYSTAYDFVCRTQVVLQWIFAFSVLLLAVLSVALCTRGLIHRQAK
jgi:hypothetical protein